MRRLDGGDPVGLAGDIVAKGEGGSGAPFGVNLRRAGLGAGKVEVCQEHARALAGQRRRRAGANALSRAGHERQLPLHACVHASSPGRGHSPPLDQVSDSSGAKGSAEPPLRAGSVLR